MDLEQRARGKLPAPHREGHVERDRHARERHDFRIAQQQAGSEEPGEGTVSHEPPARREQDGPEADHEDVAEAEETIVEGERRGA